MRKRLKTFIVACNAEPTCIIVAFNKKQAEDMARKQADADMGDCDDHWTGYEVGEYFSDMYDKEFFGWIKSPGHTYLEFT